ncbi:hypothetical protein TVAG_290260 [Trichomonas vaginalis G3]|uniref:Uncharacterized protein n=1 Tax=Trichomonas vaginalis (strain ATCC PRA-98 / G3) TaxID=412133 RepID=A2F7Q2_TRIV3|nr:hypothetical protein TVAGG3_0405750 [Trichomonas vaginalis G3]EAX99079.1 hypothetical protein TVAG_290260 [Trichomonas vaginalis G3]KAI5535015.1 hypothetical protein TVAGG3_0405750 [Trichomonas vaginalis G3]|eukprot:XP_001312009.1 hypothetical protein [Trichomonas vaginalis G3]
MGLCCSQSEIQRPDQIYASLVLPKPPPIEVNDIKPESDDIPLFAPVSSDDDDIEISDTGLNDVSDDEDEDENEEKEEEEEEEKPEKEKMKETPKRRKKSA